MDERETRLTLEPCPFCGGPISIGKTLVGEAWAIDCEACDCAGRPYPTKAEAIATWNTRTLRSVEPAPRERAAKFLDHFLHDYGKEAFEEATERLAAELAALRSQTLDEAARVADAVEGHFAAKTAIENHGKWTIGSDAARKIAAAIRALQLPPGIK